MAATRELASVARIADASEAQYDKLSPGPGMSATEVGRHQRARLHRALTQIVAERGFAAVTVRELSSVAGVSTRTFYEHFRDKEDCLGGSCEIVAEELSDVILTAQAEVADEREGFERAIAAIARYVAADPWAAHLALIEARALGPELAQGRAVEGVLGGMVERALLGGVNGSRPSRLLAKGVAGGVARVVVTRVLEHRADEIAELSGELSRWVLSFRGRAAPRLGRAVAHVQLGEAAGMSWRTAGRDSAVEDDRSLILLAATKIALEEGFRGLTVPRVRAAAGVSRKAFNANFESAEECFLAALELYSTRMLGRLAERAAGDDWSLGVHRTIASLVAQIVRDEDFARLDVIEATLAGPAGLRCQEAILTASADLLRASAPAPLRPAALAAEASVGAMWHIIECHLESGLTQELPRAIPTLAFLALLPGAGAEVASEAIRRGSAAPKGGA